MRTARFELIENVRPEVSYHPTIDIEEPASSRAVVARRDAGTLDPLLAARCFAAPGPPFELYDLLADPAETQNLARDPAYAAEPRRHQELLSRWMLDTNDFMQPPLLDRPDPVGETDPRVLPAAP